MHFLEIAEASLDDVGEYTLTAESAGGTVRCTVAVDVVSELEVSSALKKTSHPFAVAESVEQVTPLEQVDSEAPKSSKPTGTAETGEVVVTDGTELPRAAEAAPVFISTPQPANVEEGSPVHLQCQVEG